MLHTRRPRSTALIAGGKAGGTRRAPGKPRGGSGPLVLEIDLYARHLGHRLGREDPRAAVTALSERSTLPTS